MKYLLRLVDDQSKLSPSTVTEIQEALTAIVEKYSKEISSELFPVFPQIFDLQKFADLKQHMPEFQPVFLKYLTLMSVDNFYETISLLDNDLLIESYSPEEIETIKSKIMDTIFQEEDLPKKHMEAVLKFLKSREDADLVNFLQPQNRENQKNTIHLCLLLRKFIDDKNHLRFLVMGLGNNIGKEVSRFCPEFWDLKEGTLFLELFQETHPNYISTFLAMLNEVKMDPKKLAEWMKLKEKYFSQRCIELLRPSILKFLTNLNVLKQFRWIEGNKSVGKTHQASENCENRVKFYIYKNHKCAKVDQWTTVELS